MTLPDNIKSRIEREAECRDTIGFQRDYIDGATIWAERAWKLRDALEISICTCDNRGFNFTQCSRCRVLKEFDEGMK